MRKTAISLLTFLALLGHAFANTPPGDGKQSKNDQRTQTLALNAATTNELKEIRGVLEKIVESRSTHSNNETDAWTPEKLTAWGTVALAVITAILALYTALLFKATVRLGNDAQKASARQERETKESLDQARKSAEAAENANKLSREALIADQRPWISPTFELTSGVSRKANGYHFSLLFRLKNIGKSPALNVWPESEVHGQFGNFQPATRQREHAKTLAERPPSTNLSLGYTIFPGDEFAIEVGLNVPIEHVIKFNEMLGTMDVKDFKFLPPVTVLGSITYRTTFDDQLRYTGFILELHQIDPTRPHINLCLPVLDEDAPEFPINRLRLTHSFISGAVTV